MWFYKVKNIIKNSNLHINNLKDILSTNLNNKLNKIEEKNNYNESIEIFPQNLKKTTIKKLWHENSYKNSFNLDQDSSIKVKKKSKILNQINLSDIKINDIDSNSKSSNNISGNLNITGLIITNNIKEKQILVCRIKNKIQILKSNRNKQKSYSSNEIRGFNSQHITKIELILKEIEEENKEISINELKNLDNQLII